MTEIRLSLRLLHRDDIAIGPGKADLLEAIAATGSISAAGRRMGLSYRRAWLLVDTMNRAFAAPLVVASKGGAKGGGAALTEGGATVLAAYRDAGRAASDASAAAIARIVARLA